MLTQPEAEQLMQTAKRFVRPPAAVAIPPGVDETYELTAIEGREKFLLDLWRGTIRISKLKFQERVRITSVLARLDVNGAPHTNPDLTTVPGTHLHLYREGFEDRWAFPVDAKLFSRLGDPAAIFRDFCAFCNIVEPPPAQGWIE